VLVNPAVQLSNAGLGLLPVLKHLVPSLHGIGSDIAKPGVTELAYDRTPLKALHSSIQGYARVVRDLPQITQPLLLLHSPQDHVVPPKSSSTVLSRVSSKDVTEVLLHRSYHVATLDHDADVIERSSSEFITRITATGTSPVTSVPRCSASRRARAPPIDRPPTTTSSQRARRSVSARSTVAYQSSQRVRFISCHVVPWPGRRGTRTVRPSSARCRAQAARDDGLPVNPWHKSTPTGPPS